VLRAFDLQSWRDPGSTRCRRIEIRFFDEVEGAGLPRFQRPQIVPTPEITIISSDSSIAFNWRNS
jgi:hypothetical protein